MTILPSLFLLNKISQFIQIQEGEKFSLNYGLFLLAWKSGLRVNEAISFDYQLKHPKHKDLYLVKGKGNKARYVYVSKEIIQKLKSNHWKPNQTNRINFYHFLQRIKKELNISPKIELTPHTLRRCFTTHNALNGVPIPILQKALGHKNICTTSFYWKGSVDIREFGGWLEPDSSPREPEETPKFRVGDNPQLPKTQQNPLKLESPKDNTKETKLLKTIEKLKGELAEKDKQIISLTNENKKIKSTNQEKDRKLRELQEKVKQLTTKNKSLIENYANLKNAVKNQGKIKEKQGQEFIPKNDEFLFNNLSKIKKPQNNSLAVKEKDQTELIAEIQVWKPPN